MSNCRLMVIAFDIDNTLTDPEGVAYQETTAEFLSIVDVGLSPDERFRAYEGLRARGDPLERLGLGNPLHYRNHPEGLAVLCLTSGVRTRLRRDLDINPDDQPGWRQFVIELTDLQARTKHGSWESRLAAEIALQRFCATDPRVVRFCSEVKRVGQCPQISGWAQRYDTIERQRPASEVHGTLTALAARGAIPVVISEGRIDVQMKKLGSIGLGGSFPDRVLITEAVAGIAGVKELDEAISRLIDARIGTKAASEDDKLAFLWHFRGLINTWETKSPWFFGRCLHALHEAPARPEAALARPVFVRHERWHEEPLRFVMVGDRYEKDVEPLIDLLGPGVGMKIRLQMGKYGDTHPELDLPPDRRPDRTFTDWESLAGFLSHELTPELVKPITEPPDIAPRNELRREYIDRGLRSESEAVRVVAEAVKEMLRPG